MQSMYVNQLKIQHAQPSKQNHTMNHASFVEV